MDDVLLWEALRQRAGEELGLLQHGSIITM